MTNNSLSNLLPVPPKKPPLLTPATQSSRSRTPPPPPSTSNGANVQSKSTSSDSVRHTPLTIQTGSTVKVESPHMTSLNSPATLSALDRLAPIRAAKASLTSRSGVQSPVNNNEMRRIGPDASIPKTPADSRQNPAPSQPSIYQTAALPQQQPPPVQSLSQQLPVNSGQQGRPIPAQLEGVLETLRSQFPQLGVPAQSTINNAVNPATTGQNAPPSGVTSQASHHMTPPSIPRFANAGGTNNPRQIPQGYGVGTPQGTYNGSMTIAQANPIQTPRPYGQWPSSSSGTSANATPQQPTTNVPIPIPVGPHGLPQRPVVVPTAPNNFVRAEPLGPPPRSASSESAGPDGRRGPYHSDRRRPSDDRRFNRYDRHQDDDRNKRNWFRGRGGPSR